MVALESNLRSSTKGPSEGYTSLPSVFFAIEYNLPPNYRRHHDNQHGYYWIYRAPKTNLSAHIYPQVDHDSLTSLFLTIAKIRLSFLTKVNG